MDNRFTQSQIKVLVAGIDELLTGTIKFPGTGICFNLGMHYHLDSEGGHKDDVYHLVKMNGKNWIHFSGSESFPIPFPIVEYNGLFNYLWTGEQLKFRKSLLKSLRRKLLNGTYLL